MTYIDPTTVVIKDHVKNNQQVEFAYYRDGQFWYKTELGFLFPISMEEVTSTRVTLLAKDKALLFMRWMRKYIDDSIKSQSVEDDVRSSTTQMNS